MAIAVFVIRCDKMFICKFVNYDEKKEKLSKLFGNCILYLELYSWVNIESRPLLYRFLECYIHKRNVIQSSYFEIMFYAYQMERRVRTGSRESFAQGRTLPRNTNLELHFLYEISILKIDIAMV